MHMCTTHGEADTLIRNPFRALPPYLDGEITFSLPPNVRVYSKPPPPPPLHHVNPFAALRIFSCGRRHIRVHVGFIFAPKIYNERSS
jgi:hypothetical protein